MQIKVTILTLVFAALLHLGCSAAKEDNDKNKRDENRTTVSLNNLTPETARISAVVRNLRTLDNNSGLCELEINEVYEYGPSTPPLAAGTSIQVIIPSSLSKINSIQNDNTYQLTISHLQLMKGQNLPEWKAITIK